MPLKIFNSLTRNIEVFEPLDPSKVKMYVCGITPYDETHLGHARAYVTFDIVRRYLEYSGYKVEHVQNFTDIDDKIIKKANSLQLTASDIAEKYIQSYFEVMDKLNVKRATVYPKATEHIKEMIAWIKALVELGIAYQVESDFYFEVSKFSSYGKLSKRKKKDLQAGARIEADMRRKDPLDFALWKGAKEGEPAWESPWGFGRPGWHIECSVMSTKYLGDQLDIHGGGLDLEFPHHENEIAQTEAKTRKDPWVKYWMHNGFVNINQQKMSKSLGNFFTLKDIFEKYGPMVVRLFLLSNHYRSLINFSDVQLTEANEAYQKLIKAIENLDFLISKVGEPEDKVEKLETDDELLVFKEKFVKIMDEDFNSAGALGVIFELVHFINEHVKSGKIDKGSLRDDKELLLKLCQILGLELKMSKTEDTEVQKLVTERDVARKSKNYKLSDELRKKIESFGYLVEDTAHGTKISRRIP